jgi:hypothetical protein
LFGFDQRLAHLTPQLTRKASFQKECRLCWQ